MFIERLELVGYRRLLLNNIQHLIYTPTSPYQLILGTNGSGKSSLLAELSPLPADASDYIKQGSKQITIRHNAAHYVLTSVFKSGGKHSFLKNDEELNPGGTTTVQKELVRREFGIWGELHDLLTGRLRFTTMSSQQRRDWISLLSETDYSYALSTFQKFKTNARDRQAVVKHLKQRLTQETSNLSMISSVEDDQFQQQQIVEELNVLLSERVPSLGTFADTHARMQANLDRIVEVERLIQKYYRSVPANYEFQSLKDVELEISKQDGVVNNLREFLSLATQEHEELETTIRRFAEDEHETPTNIQEEIERLEDDLQRLKEQSTTFSEISDARQTLQDTQTVLEDLVALFRLLPDNTDRHLSRERVTAAQARRQQLQTNVDRSTTSMMKIQRHLTLMADSQSNECPSCKYIWRPGYSESEVTQHEVWLAEHQTAIEVAESELENLTHYFEQVEEYTGQCQRFRGFVGSYPRLKKLWDHILDEKILTDRPAERASVFYQWLADVQVLATVEGHEERLKRLYRMAEQQQMGGTVALQERMHKLHERIDSLTFDIRKVVDARKALLEYRGAMEQFMGVAAEADRLRATIENDLSNTVQALRNECIDQVVRQHQIDLAQIQQKLSTHHTLTGIVKDLRTTLTQSAIEYEAYSILMHALSPVDGIIAEQMIGFIGCLVEQMNAIIQSVWTHDLTVLSCGTGSGELDYKFPATVGDGLRIDDVKEGSTAQKEVFNFAFMLTVMLYLDLKEYPLFLDELGAGFDEQHRINVMQFIKQLMDLKQHSQMFMISHYVGSWGVFVGAQHLVLDASNIAVPDGHNQHAVLK